MPHHHPLTRRAWIETLCAVGCAGVAKASRASDEKPRPVPGLMLTPRHEILERATAARPLRGGVIPADLVARLGIAHAGPKYSRTDKPILIEGAEQILACGPRVGKFWLGDVRRVYDLHSDWSGIDRRSSFVDVVRHPYFAAVLAMPFSTIVLQIGTAHGTRGLDAATDFSRDEEEMERLVEFLFRTYADKPCTFILQNWEGDWIVRGDDKDWSHGVPAGGMARLDGLAAWWRARQRGVSRARAAAPAGCHCRVLHAAEVNRVADGLQGIPVAATHSLPQAPVDLVSWSSYDGLESPVKAWRCLDLLEQMAVKEGGGKPPIMIGEVGVPETGRTESEVIDRWDAALGVFFARRVSYVLHWALYCNEPRDHDHKPRPHELEAKEFVADELRGFWWIRPDGSISWGGRYLASLLEHAGGRLPGAA